MANPPNRPSGPFRPARLGQWEVIAKIAGGGMSAVYLGRRKEPAPDIPNVVALKIVRHDVRMDERMLNMFLEEGRLIARLVHPNIVRTLEVGGDGEQEYIAMELMLGKTFSAIHDAIAARDVRLNPEIVAWAVARIADALHYAHELASETGAPLALVHRDVNPANVFATFQGEVKLFDFGLAKVTAGEATGSQLLAGKLSYLSPEQIMQMPLDRRSDIFSLGTTLWELLTGRRLFRRDSDLDTVRAVQLGPIPDPRQVAPEIPEELARIAKTALERNREHRYPNALYLSRELDAFVFQRTSPGDVTARLAQLVDTLFPGEQKRQSGWLKPAITSSGARLGSGSGSGGSINVPGPVSMAAAALSAQPSSSQPSAAPPVPASSSMKPIPTPSSIPVPPRRPSPPPRFASREITQVMPNAPQRPEGSTPGFQAPVSGPASSGAGGPNTARSPSAPSSSPRMPSSSPRIPSSAPRMPPSSSPRIPSSAPASTPRIPTVAPSSRRLPSSQKIPAAVPSSAPMAADTTPHALDPTPRDGTPAALSATARDGSPALAATAPAGTPALGAAGSPGAGTPALGPRGTLPPPSGRPSGWPGMQSSNRPGSLVPPPPSRTRPPAPATAAPTRSPKSTAPPPPPPPDPGELTEINSDPHAYSRTDIHSFSRTDIHAFNPPPTDPSPMAFPPPSSMEAPPVAAPAPVAVPEPAKETSTPGFRPSSASIPPGPFSAARPKRAPIPLPSRLKTEKKPGAPATPATTTTGANKPATMTEPPDSDTKVDMPAMPTDSKKKS